MKNLRQFSIYSSAAGVEGETVESTTGVSPLRKQRRDIIILNNPKVDTQLLSDYHRLVDASKDVTKRKRGANYRLSHPFGSNDVPTDAIPIGRRRDIIKKRKHR